MDCQDHVAEMRKRKKERKTPLGVQPDEVKFGFKIFFCQIHTLENLSYAQQNCGRCTLKSLMKEIVSTSEGQ